MATLNQWQTWNAAYLQFLSGLYSKMRSCRPLFEWVRHCTALVKVDRNTLELFSAAEPDLAACQEGIFASEETVLDRLWPQLGLRVLYAGLTEADRASVMWAPLVSLCRMTCIMKVGQQHLNFLSPDTLERIRTQVQTPSANMGSVLSELLTTDTAGSILTYLQDPERLRTLLGQFSTLLRTPGQPALDLSPLLEMLPKPGDDPAAVQKELQEFQEFLGQGHLTELMQQALAQGGMQPPSSAAAAAAAAAASGPSIDELLHNVMQRAQEHKEGDAGPQPEDLKAMLAAVMSRAQSTLAPTLLDPPPADEDLLPSIEEVD